VDFVRGRILTEGNLLANIWSLAWPVMLSMFFQTLYNAVDAFWVSRFSPDAMAAVSISQLTLFVMISLSMGITVGSGVLMAMAIGRRDIIEAERILGQSFVLSAIAGAVFTAISLLFRRPLLSASGATGGILPLALVYFTIIASGSMLVFLLFSVLFAFNSQGDNKTVTVLFSISTAVNAILDPVLIFGWAGFPALGIAGAAIATLFLQALVLVAGLVILRRANMLVAFRFSRLGLRWASVKKVLNIGFPAALTNVVGPLSLAALTAIIAGRFREAGATSFSIGFRAEFFAYLPAVGFGVSALALLGQNTGARRFDRVRSAYRLSLALAFGAATLLGLLAAAFRERIIGVFTSDPQVASYARAYFLSVPFSYGLFATVFVEIMSLQGMGRSWGGFLLALLRAALVASSAYLLLQVLRVPLLGGWLAVATINLLLAALGYLLVRSNLRSLEIQAPAWSGLPETPAAEARAGAGARPAFSGEEPRPSPAMRGLARAGGTRLPHRLPLRL
jgi:putative MATE family efflux protein